MPTEHERETAFLRRCIRYDESATGVQLDERIARVQRDERCLRRTTWLMALIVALAVAALGFGVVFLDDFPNRLPVFFTQFVIKLACVLGIGSLICLLAFAAAGFVYRKELNRRREECRRRVTKLLESQEWRTRPATNGGVEPKREKDEKRRLEL